MDREDLTRSNSNLMVYLRNYNFKLCRKGLLERARNMNLLVGDFSEVENTFIKEVSGSNDLNYKMKIWAVFKANMSAKMESELGKLKIQIKSLGLTINNVKDMVRLGTSEDFYSKWIKKINGVATRFKQKYSNEFNSLYDHIFRMNKLYGEDWNNIAYDIQSISKDIQEFTMDKNQEKNIVSTGELWDSDVFEEGDLQKIFNEIEGSDQSSLIGTQKRERKEENVGVKRMKLTVGPADELIPISDDEMANQDGEEKILKRVGFRVVDEVGSVDMDVFNSLLQGDFNK